MIFVTKLLRIITCMMFLLLEAAAFGQSWYNASWQARKKLTIDYTKVGSNGAPHTDYPVLVSHTDDALKNKALSTGYDILFTLSDGVSKLNHEIESYTSSTGTIVAWVKIPSLSASTNTELYMYYGNAASGNQQNETGTWNSNFKVVWHLEEPAGMFYDVTSNAYHGYDSVTATGKTGKIGSGQEFDGLNDEIKNRTLSWNPTSFSVSFWIYPFSNSDYNQHVAAGWDKFVFHNTSTGAVYCGTELTNRFTPSELPANTVTTGAWQQFTFTYDGTNGRFYKNGAQLSTAKAMTPPTGWTKFGIGSDNTNNTMHCYADETRVSSNALSVGWINTDYNNQSSPSTFYSIGGEEIQGGWYSCAWPYRKKITVDYTKVGSTGAPHSSFPVLISLSTDAQLSAKALSNGYDILFTSENGTTKLDHQRVSYSSGNLEAWVEVPFLSASANTFLYLYYGNASSSDQQAAAATWNSNFKRVYHMQENASNTVVVDATATSNGTSQRNTSSLTTTGKVGNAFINASASSDYTNIGTTGIVNINTYTYSAWVKVTTNPSNGQFAGIIRVGDEANGDQVLQISNNYNSVTGWTFISYCTGGSEGTTSNGLPSTGVWYYLTAVRSVSGNYCKIYLNGALSNTDASLIHTDANYGSPWPVLGFRPISGVNKYLNGVLDEVRISSIANTEGWILTEYNNQNSPSTFYSIAGEEVGCVNKGNFFLQFFK